MNTTVLLELSITISVTMPMHLMFSISGYIFKILSWKIKSSLVEKLIQTFLNPALRESSDHC